jgi:DNA invertase Pin-like site-specific DNA recombinase
MTDQTISTKKAALNLLAHGLATYSEIAELAGVRRQTVRWWARELPADSRAVYLQDQWAKALKQAGK